MTDQMVLTIGYDIDNLKDPKSRNRYQGEVTVDRYGRSIPKHAHGSVNLKCQTSSTQMIMEAVMDLYDRIVDPHLLVRRVTVNANHVMDEAKAKKEEHFEQIDLFTDYEALEKQRREQEEKLARERKLQEYHAFCKEEIWEKCYVKRNEPRRRRQNHRAEQSDWRA